MGLTRRRFLGGAVLLAATPAWSSCQRREQAQSLSTDAGTDAATADAPTELVIGQWTVPPGTALSPARFAALLALMDALIPGDASSPGATEAHAAWYLDQLLGAFRCDPPRIYAGGPFSGRQGGIDGFASFQPLTRVENLRWRTFLEGSQGLPEREWNGPVIGLTARYESGLDALEAAARKAHGKGLAELEREQTSDLLDGADPDFVQTAYEHAVEGTYGDPVYGGNFEGKGWQAIDYEGDRQPIGYTARQMSHPEEG